MACSRDPGAVGRNGSVPNIQDGTLCRQSSPIPGSVGILEKLESSLWSQYENASRFADSEYETLKGNLQSRYEAASRYLKSDYEGARCLFQAYLEAQELAPAAIYEETGCELRSLLDGLIPGLLQVLAVVGATTFIGAAVGGIIGFFFGGVGAAPGAVIGGELGFDVGTAVLTWLGLGFLIVAIARGFAEMVDALRNGVQWAWAAGQSGDPDEERQVHRAANELARASGILMRLILEGIVAYLLKEGAMGATRGALRTTGALRTVGAEAAADEIVAGLAGKLRASRLGRGFGDWVEKNWRDLVENRRLQPKQAVPSEQITPASSSSETPKPKTEPKGSKPDKSENKSVEDLIAQRRATAEKFYRSKGWSEKKIADHLKGINFNKPVEVATLKKGTVIEQWQPAAGQQGNYYCPPGSDPATLGINPAGRVKTVFETTRDVEVLKSTAADIPAWEGSGASYQGGGTQYFTTDKTAFGPH